ncbi:type II toxin-antitoxin system Phd/YefM family antitoxin [Pedobacter psychroterrae]|uniref:Antitoxin n=1 Tax=Pedobacter psychroterrae TaxID=2530453 RepID=A0A4R0NJJ7_9SPHI|nr:type II toxin-antitoxin system prevent-host-death family antitoxin [Pedobacter psychroterrae]TCD00389.1 type II toxin-antitoxin system prevent-host-death family antitoxin [Pedobacter psychroterrae]
MEITTYSNFRQHLKSFLDKVFLSQGPLYISRNNGEDVVVLSKADYESLMETFHLMKSPKNASRLMEGIVEYKKGKGQERSLIEE